MNQVTTLSKEEYLKKYLSGEPEAKYGIKKKKKKKNKVVVAKVLPRVKIIDNDLDIPSTIEETPITLSDEEFADNEDLPVIASVQDDRAIEVQVKEEFDKSGKWKTFTEGINIARKNLINEVIKIEQDDIKDEPMSDEELSEFLKPRNNVKVKIESSDKCIKKESVTSESSIKRKRSRVTSTKNYDSDSDASSLRRYNSDGTHRRRHDSDASPPRRRHDSDASPPRRGDDSDASPPRRRHDKDASPLRRRHDSDTSPLRRRHDSDTSPPRQKHDSYVSSSRRYDSDTSPPRRKHDSDASPSRSRRHDYDAAIANLNQTRKSSQEDSDISPPRKHCARNDSDISPPRKGRDSDSDVSPPRLKETLDGKKAGLQNALDLKDELDMIRRKERRMMDELSDDVSGRNAQTRVRGRLAEAEAKKAEEKKRKEVSDHVKQKYETWNKGVAQVKEANARLEDNLYEMSKPLARGVDDDDRDAMLRDRDREDDPMAEYMRKKKAKLEGRKKRFPQYQGPQPPPNRFGLKPGYRWDGVDRSNGFEKRLMTQGASKKAQEEESYKWSTEDM